MKRIALLFFAACVPADNALSLGSLEFEMKASHITMEGIRADAMDLHYAVHVDRALFALKTVTIGETKVPDKCSYRGRGEVSNVVFDVRYGNTQVFNGLEATTCPDVGFVFQGPDGDTIPGAGATGADLVMLADGDPAHAYIEMTATRFDGDTYRIQLRFDTLRTSSRFGGCHTDVKGVKVAPGKRLKSTIAFTADALFRESIDGNANLRIGPYLLADKNHDQLVTMDELDALSLAELNQSPLGVSYHLQNGLLGGTLGDYVRSLLKFAFFFDENGSCVGDDPGTPEEQ